MKVAASGLVMRMKEVASVLVMRMKEAASGLVMRTEVAVIALGKKGAISAARKEVVTIVVKKVTPTVGKSRAFKISSRLQPMRPSRQLVELSHDAHYFLCS